MFENEYLLNAIDLYDAVELILPIVLVGVVIPCQLYALYLHRYADHTCRTAGYCLGNVYSSDEGPRHDLVYNQVQQAGCLLLLEEGQG